MGETENLSAFLARTEGFIYDSLPTGGFSTGGGLALKVGPEGRMEAFWGNTVVFPLPEEARRGIGQIRERLYRVCGPILAEPLEEASFHITLHDLLSGKPSGELQARMDAVRQKALACVERIAEKRERVRVRSTALFNMVNTSMVLGFAPADEESCGRLMGFYEMLQEVVPLGYPLTPHVTVAYFRPGTIRETEGLRAVVREVGQRDPMEIELVTDTLVYQVFSDMNHYWNDMDM